MIHLYSEQLEFNILKDYDYWNPDFHMHNFYEIFFLRAGEIDFYVNNTKRHIEPGTMVFLTDHDIHKSRMTSEGLYERSFIHIPPSFIEKLSSSTTNLSDCFHDANGPFFSLSSKQGEAFYNAVKNMIHLKERKEYGYDIMVQAELMKILVSVNSLCKSSIGNKFQEQYSKRICDIIYYIEEHLNENLSLDRISKAFSIDKYHLCHTFKEETATTVYHFIQLKRITLAKHMLLEGNTLMEACYGSGFNNYSHFITTYKKISGMTPKQYLKLYKE